jgi:DNA repair protein RadC
MQTSLFKEMDLKEDILLPPPKTKFESKFLNGSEFLSNADLLSFIIKGSNSDSLAEKLLSGARNSLNSIARMSVVELSNSYGLSKKQACSIVAAFELNRRRNLEISLKSKITTSKAAQDILKPLIGDSHYEIFYILLLNRANFVIGHKKVSDGGITGTVVDIRRLFKYALEGNATSIIIGHNHPSGNILPSEADRILTRKIKAAGELLDIAVLDHIIITSAEGSYYSFADEGFG